MLLKPTAINTSYCVDAIAVVEKNATICELFLSCIGGLDHRYRLLNFQPQNFPWFFSSSLLGFHFSHLSFSLSLFSNSQSQILAELHLLRHQHLHPSFHPRARQNHHPLCCEHHHQLCAKNIIPIRMFFFFFLNFIFVDWSVLIVQGILLLHPSPSSNSKVLFHSLGSIPFKVWVFFFFFGSVILWI